MKMIVTFEFDEDDFIKISDDKLNSVAQLIEHYVVERNKNKTKKKPKSK